MILTVKQTQALDFLEDNITKELVFGGGAGGAKSFLGCYWQLKNRIKYPETKGLIGRSKLKTLKETTLQTFWKVCKMMDIKRDLHFTYNDQKSIIYFFNGSEILLKDLFNYPSDPEFDELGSLEITDAFIDEANQVVKKAKQIVRSRIRHNLQENKLIPKLLMTCNPAKNWVYNDFYKADRDGTIKDEYKFIQALANDNQFIDNNYIHNLQSLDENSKQRLLYGNWEYDDDPAALVGYDAICDMFTNEHVENGERYISADLAMQGRDKFIAGYWNGLKCEIAIDMDKSTGKEIETKIVELKNNKGVGNSHIVADSDGLGAYLNSYIENIIDFHGGAKPLNKEYANLKAECAYKLAEKINKREIYVICSDRQKELIMQEVEVCLKSDGVDKDEGKLRIIKKEKMKEQLNRSPDYLDMLIMRMYFELHQDFDQAISVF